MCVHIFWYFKIQFMSINSCASPPFLFSLLYWCIFIALSGIIYRSQFDLCQSVARLCPTQYCHRPITLHFPFLFVNFAQPPRSLCSMQWCMGLPMRVCHNEKMRKWQTGEGWGGWGGSVPEMGACGSHGMIDIQRVRPAQTSCVGSVTIAEQIFTSLKGFVSGQRKGRGA